MTDQTPQPSSIDATRRSLLKGDELVRLHQLLWESAQPVPGESRRRHKDGVKWLLRDHFGIETGKRAGPYGKVREDALARLVEIGALERIGGGLAQRTSKCWVTDPGFVQYPWSGDAQ